MSSSTILSKISRSAIPLLWTLTLALPGIAQAQVYRCEVGGKVEYQQHPCADAARQSSKLMAAPASKPELWTAVLTQGMTPEQVRQAVPQARPGGNDSLKNGARQLLRMEPTTVAGLDFDAKFFFLNDKFLRVNFSGPMNVDNEVNLRAFDKIAEIFQSRYGAPANRKVSNARHGLSARAEWNLRQGEVWMIISPVSANTSSINFGFLPKEP